MLFFYVLLARMTAEDALKHPFIVSSSEAYMSGCPALWRLNLASVSSLAAPTWQ